MLWRKRSSDAYIDYLRKRGVKIGKGVKLRPKSCIIDLTRPSLIQIGDNVMMNNNFILMTHDFVTGVILNVYHDFLPSSGKVTIGNNVRFGVNCTVLKGVTIGNNCFIAAGAVVTSDIPSDSIASGNPAKVVSTLATFYKYRQIESISESFKYIKSIKERYGRDPVPADCWEEFPLFVDKTNINNYPEIPFRKQLGNNYDVWLSTHTAPYKSFEDFINAVFTDENNGIMQHELEKQSKPVIKKIKKEKFRELFSNALSCKLSEVDDLEYKKSENWDSIGHMNIISALELQLGISLRAEDVGQIKSFRGSIEVLNKYGIEIIETSNINSLFLDFRNYYNSVAVIDKNREYTYKEIDEAVEYYKSRLQQGKLAFLLAENTIGSLISYIACLKVRVPVALLDAKKDVDILRGAIDAMCPEYIILPSNRSKDFKGSSMFSLYDYEVVHYETTHYIINDDLAVLLTTSGSTGSPKFVRLSLENLASNAQSIVSYLGINNNERPITSLPMYYSYGLSVINSHLLVGSTILLSNYSVIDPEFWKFAEEQKATSVSGVPYTYEIFQKIHLLDKDLPYLKTFTQAGGKMNAEDVKQFALLCSKQGKRFFVMYGQTEATARISYLPSDRTIEKSGSIGIAIPDGKLSIAEDGELVYEGKNVSMGYAESYLDLSKGDERKGKLNTGDLATIDDDGFYYITGRKKRFLKVYGNRVGLDELEQLLFPVFGKVYCVGEDNHVYIISSSKDVNNDTILDYVANKTRLNKNAFTYIYLEDIPYNSTGKVLYSKLKEIVIKQ